MRFRHLHIFFQFGFPFHPNLFIKASDMLSRWLQRGNIGQILAPDESCKDQEEKASKQEFSGGWWQVLAPDPNYASPSAAAAAAAAATGTRNEHFDAIMTPTKQGESLREIGDVAYNTPSKGVPPRASTHLFSPSTTSNKPHGNAADPNQPHNAHTINPNPKLQSQVLSAAQGTAFSIASPTAVWEEHKKFFNFAASTTKLTAKQLTRFEKLMTRNPTLVHVRASKMNVLVPDGFTPVHAAAYAGNLEVIQLLIDFTLSKEENVKKVPIKKEETNETSTVKEA